MMVRVMGRGSGLGLELQLSILYKDDGLGYDVGRRVRDKGVDSVRVRIRVRVRVQVRVRVWVRASGFEIGL